MKPTEQEIVANWTANLGRGKSINDDIIDTVNWAIENALEGMIPADQAIRLDWPDGSTHAWIVYHTQNGQMPYKSNTVYRPRPQWKPKVGDPVFFIDTAVIYRVSTVTQTPTVFYSLHGGMVAEAGQLKPATIADMGKNWGDI